jgi:hypothetical protein
MQKQVRECVVSKLLTPFKEVPLYGPFCDQVSAMLASKMHKSLEGVSTAEEDYLEVADEDLEESIKNVLYEIYESFKKVLNEDALEESPFVEEAGDTLIESLDDIPSKPISMPQYTVTKGKGKGKTTPTILDGPAKVLNPKTGVMVVRIGKDGKLGRTFKKLMEEGLVNEDGSFTEDGKRLDEEREAAKPKKVPHPTRKGGEIVLNGKAFKALIEKGYTFDEDSEEWCIPEGKEEKPVSKNSKPGKPGTKNSRKKPVSEKIPHPTRKNGQIVKNGEAHKKLLQQGWVFDEEERTWSKEEEDDDEATEEMDGSEE